MTTTKSILICVLFMAIVSCKKHHGAAQETLVEIAPVSESERKFQHFGDYRVDVTPEVSSKAASGFHVYNSLPWKKGEVVVKFQPTISKAHEAQFWNACQEWSNVAKITCRNKKKSDKSYVLITDQVDQGCWTDVGAGAKGGERVFNFGSDWCWNHQALIHEVGHVLGLMHEHQRPDRDAYIEVRVENAGSFAFAYEKLSLGPMDNKGPYDFMSIMHYWNGSYSINGLPIMIPRKGYEAFANTMGYSTKLSDGDKKLIRKIYGSR